MLRSMSPISVTPGGSTMPPSASRQSSICSSPTMTAVYASLRVVAATCDGPRARRPAQVRIFPSRAGHARREGSRPRRANHARVPRPPPPSGGGGRPGGRAERHVPTDMVDALVASAWLHDIGYAPALRQTGFHPLDGATYLRQEGWPDDVCALVAHHSGSRFVARINGLDGSLGKFEFA